MIQLSRRGLIQYQFLNLIVLLLVFYGAAFLLSAVFQLPAHPLGDLLNQATVNRFAARCFQLLVLSGFLAAGLSMGFQRLSERATAWLQGGWIAIVALSLIASPSAPPSFTDFLAAVFLLVVLALSVTKGEGAACTRVWQLGTLLICLSLLAPYLATDQWKPILSLFQLHVAYGVCAVSMIFWLMTKFSNVESQWISDGVKVVAALVLFAGSLISIAPLSLTPLISLSAAPLILLAFTILAGHCYRALSDRNANASLAPHWIALATLFWLIAGGFMGALSVHAGINDAMRDTVLPRAQDWLMGGVLLSVICAYVNASASELRGENRRVTGYVPLWLIAFGVGLSSIVQGCAGVLEIYLRKVFDQDQSAITELLQPLTVIWIVCLSAVFVGIVTYALGYWARRPKIQVVSP